MSLDSDIKYQVISDKYTEIVSANVTVVLHSYFLVFCLIKTSRVCTWFQTKPAGTVSALIYFVFVGKALFPYQRQ